MDKYPHPHSDDEDCVFDSNNVFVDNIDYEDSINELYSGSYDEF